MTNVVLMHGAYQGGWIWRDVAAGLRAKGCNVFAPTLDGCAERSGQIRPGITTETHGEEIAKLLFFEDLSDVVMVGTSSGGMVLANAAEQARERVSRLVLADALALMPGEKIRDIVVGPAAVEGDISLGPTPEDAAGRMFRGLDAETAAWAAARCTLHPAGVFREPVKLSSFWNDAWDASVIYCRQAPNPGEAHQRRAATALGARWHELDTGHYPMLSTPDALTDLILNG